MQQILNGEGNGKAQAQAQTLDTISHLFRVVQSTMFKARQNDSISMQTVISHETYSKYLDSRFNNVSLVC